MRRKGNMDLGHLSHNTLLGVHCFEYLLGYDVKKHNIVLSEFKAEFREQTLYVVLQRQQTAAVGINFLKRNIRKDKKY